MPMVRRADGKYYYESRYGLAGGILGGSSLQKNQVSANRQQTGGNGDGDEGQDGKTDSVATGPASKGTANAIGTGVGFGMGMAGIKGGSTVSGVVSDATQGTFDPAKTGLNLTKDVVSAVAPSWGGPVGAAVNIGMGAYSGGWKGGIQSAVPTATSIIGGVVTGPWGSLLGGYLGSQAVSSYNDGYIGDAFDSRRHEGLRDYGEDQGWSDKEMGENISEMDREVSRGLQKDPGSGNNSAGSSTNSKGEQAGWGDTDKSPGGLAGYARDSYSDRDSKGDGGGSGDTNGKGEGEGHGDRDKGEGGLGGY